MDEILFEKNKDMFQGYNPDICFDCGKKLSQDKLYGYAGACFCKECVLENFEKREENTLAGDQCHCCGRTFEDCGEDVYDTEDGWVCCDCIDQYCDDNLKEF